MEGGLCKYGGKLQKQSLFKVLFFLISQRRTAFNSILAHDLLILFLKSILFGKKCQFPEIFKSAGSLFLQDFL